jgi:CHAD domain-containing protein
VAFKKFRYATEILRPASDKDVHRAMNAFQTRMGYLHDLEVLLENVRTYAEQQSQQHRFLPVQEELQRRLDEEREIFMKSANGFQRFFRAEFLSHTRSGV